MNCERGNMEARTSAEVGDGGVLEAVAAGDNGIPDTIPLSSVAISDLNPRCKYTGSVESLAADMAERGTLQPIVLRKRRNGKWEVVIGVRRFKALLANRGKDGVLNSGEFRIVNWDDDKVVRAALSENTEREALAPLDEGKFLNALAEKLEAQGAKVTDALLESKTGIDRSRISDVRALSDKADVLPASWKAQLSRPANCRSGDKSEQSGSSITLTHFKHVRGMVKKTIPDDVKSVMERAVKAGWSAARFKSALEALVPKDEQPGGDPAAGNTAAAKCAQHPQQAHADDIRVGIKHLTRARAAFAKADQNLAELTLELIRGAEERMTEVGAHNSVTRETDKAA